MKKTLFVTHWSGGGVWGLKQIIQAAYMEDVTGVRMADLADLHISSSIGSVPANALLVPNPDNAGQPKFKAGDLIEPFKDCASQIFGRDGIHKHYIENTQHDIRQTLSCGDQRILRLASRVLPDRTGRLHKPHELLANFIHNYIGDFPMGHLMKSSIVQAHHMETRGRACFMALKPDMFDDSVWDHGLVCRHGDGNMSVKDVVMATTAAPTVFNAYKIGGQSFVDFDHIYSPLAVLQGALECLHEKPNGLVVGPQHISPFTPQVRMLRMMCGNQAKLAWDATAYANHGPLAMIQDFHASESQDQQKVDYAIMRRQFGAGNIVSIGADLSHLDTETPDMPSSSIFNGNRSNLRKIEDFAWKYARSQRDAMLRYADMVTETRARENIVDPSTAFGGVANSNVAVAGMPVAATMPPKSGFFKGLLSRTLGFGAPA